ncbi:MAG: ABC transporter ATP-binding protein [Anaerolineaceae bacterium]|nr:ABC transporter ATP-binding protein [Anaerolineaceae bacterium]
MVSHSERIPQEARESAIYCEDLCKNYGEVQALDHLTLAVPNGSIFGFLGRNGAGKTTTMRLLTGLIHPSGGSAYINGMRITGDHVPVDDVAVHAQFGYLPQHPVFYSWMRTREFLRYCGALYQISAKELDSRIDETLELVGLKNAEKRKIGGFSGGMKQRLGLAQALLHRPRVLLLDEPTSALDPAGRYEVLEGIRQLKGETTVFLSSHILEDVERVCDTIAILHQGKLVRVADRKALMEDFPMNTLEIDVDPKTRESIPALLQQLGSSAWVQHVAVDGQMLRVNVSDVSAGKQQVMPLLTEQGIICSRLEWVKPTLEEVFLELSE